MACVLNATNQVSRQSTHSFQRGRFLKDFYHIWAWQESWSCDLDNSNKLIPPFHKGSICNLASISLVDNHFTFSPFKSISEQIRPWHKIGQSQSRVIIWTCYNGPHSPYSYIPSFKAIGPLVLEKKILRFFFFYQIWSWRPPWPFDLDHSNQLAFHYPIKAPYAVCLQLI